MPVGQRAITHAIPKPQPKPTAGNCADGHQMHPAIALNRPAEKAVQNDDDVNCIKEYVKQLQHQALSPNGKDSADCGDHRIRIMETYHSFLTESKPNRHNAHYR